MSWNLNISELDGKQYLIDRINELEKKASLNGAEQTELKNLKEALKNY